MEKVREFGDSFWSVGWSELENLVTVSGVWDVLDLRIVYELLQREMIGIGVLGYGSWSGEWNELENWVTVPVVANGTNWRIGWQFLEYGHIRMYVFRCIQGS